VTVFGRSVSVGKGTAGMPSPWLTWLLGALGVLSFVALWVVGSLTTRFVPPVTEVIAAIPAFVSDPEVWADIIASVVRVIGALVIALMVGFAAAWVMARDNFWSMVITRYVDLTLGLPSTIAALLALFIFKRSEVGVYVVVAITTFPFVALTLYHGLKASDRRLTDMSGVYRFGWVRQVRHVAMPHLVPYTFAAVRNEYAHAWRVVVLAELFAVNSGIGWRFAQAFDRFLLIDVSLWLITFIVILLGTEYLVLRPIEQFVLRWRGSAA
jgi:NitT/TauT family transport system permease protein